MHSIKMTEEFVKWLVAFKKDSRKFVINRRLHNLSIGKFGDHKDLTGNLFELRFFNKGCAGLRIYYTIKENGEILLLLNGGTKSSQQKDIEKARMLIIKYKEVF